MDTTLHLKLLFRIIFSAPNMRIFVTIHSSNNTTPSAQRLSVTSYFVSKLFASIGVPSYLTRLVDVVTAAALDVNSLGVQACSFPGGRDSDHLPRLGLDHQRAGAFSVLKSWSNDEIS